MIKGFLSYVYWAWKTTRKMSISFKYFDIRWRGNAFIVLLFHLPWGRLNSTESLPWKDSISSLWPLPPLFWIGKRRVLASSRREVQGRSWDRRNLLRLAACLRCPSGHPQCDLLKATASHQSPLRLSNKSMRWKRKVLCVQTERELLY